MSDLLIKGGLVVDGSGARGFASDIRVKDGRIAEIGPDLSPGGERTIDASGAVVAPGFIDSHTHFDATIFWDPICDPMPQHGVTSVVAGNCSLGLAPMRPQDRVSQVDVYSFIEDMPVDVLNAAIPWNWESYEGYAQALSGQKLGINLLTFVGHSQIRIYVMGEKAWDRTATADEIGRMADQLDRALAAGALGLSYSLFDKDRQGRPVPSCLADDAEMDALFEVLGKHGAGFQFVLSGDTTESVLADLAWLSPFLERHGVAGYYNVVVHVNSDPDRSATTVKLLEELHERGVRLYGMATPRPFELLVSFESTICFIAAPVWNRLVQAEIAEQHRMVEDPRWRAAARAETDSCVSATFPFLRPELLRINSVGRPELQSWVGRNLSELIADRGGHLADVVADWLKENDFQTTFVFPIANVDENEVAKLLVSPVTFISGSDAGAHLQMFCAAGDATLLLVRYVRERGDMSIEAAVHELTGRQADVLGICDRGVLAPGKAADITIFALNELHYGPEIMVNDVPGDRSRMTRAPGGYRYTIVNGVVVQENGVATGALPARWVARRA